MRCRTLLGMSLLLGFASASAALELAVYVPDGPQDPAQIVAAFASLQPKAKAAGLSVEGRYFAQYPDFQKFVDSGAPALVLVDVPYFLQNAAGHKLQPLALARLSGTSTEQSYCLWAGSKPWNSLKDASGGRLAVTPLSGQAPYFVTDFLLEGRLPPQYFKAKPVSNARSALKAVELGEADVAFVPCSLAPAASKLRLLFKSRPVPGPVLASMGGADAQAMHKLQEWLLGLGSDEPLLRSLEFEGFSAPPAGWRQSLEDYRGKSDLSWDELRSSRPRDSAAGPRPRPQGAAPSAALPPNFEEALQPSWMSAEPLE